MHQLRLTFAGPAAADPARAARYLAVCADHDEDPAALVTQVSSGRTGDPYELTATEFDRLLEAWLHAHPATAATTAQGDPEDHPGIITAELASTAAEGITPEQRITPTGASDLPARITSIDPAVQVELERYTVAIGPELHTALRIHAARSGRQLRAITADAVTELLDHTNDAPVADPLPERWRAPANARTRLAVRWPAGLPDRLRLASERTGRPAHELLAVALIPVVTRPARGR